MYSLSVLEFTLLSTSRFVTLSSKEINKQFSYKEPYQFRTMLKLYNIELTHQRPIPESYRN